MASDFKRDFIECLHCGVIRAIHLEELDDSGTAIITKCPVCASDDAYQISIYVETEC